MAERLDYRMMLKSVERIHDPMRVGEFNVTIGPHDILGIAGQVPSTDVD
jgi:hypothetical protein